MVWLSNISQGDCSGGWNWIMSKVEESKWNREGSRVLRRSKRIDRNVGNRKLAIWIVLQANSREFEEFDLSAAGISCKHSWTNFKKEMKMGNIGSSSFGVQVKNWLKLYRLINSRFNSSYQWELFT